jgi:hypothetical protein
MTSGDMTPRRQDRQLSPEQAAAAAIVADAKARGLALTGPEGLLKLFTRSVKLFTRSVLEAALEEEMTEHLGHEKNRAPVERESANIRNGSRVKTVVSEAAGDVQIAVPRDREGTFEPQIVKKRQRRLSGVDEIVLSLYAKGLTTREISAHFEEIYGASVSKETISRITDAVLAEMNEWATRPLDRLRGDLRGRCGREDPRRPGRQPACLRGDRGHCRRPQGRPGPVGGHRRRGREVLDVGPHGPA